MKIRFTLLLLLVTLTLIQCKKTDPKPNNKWNPGEEWIDARDGQSYKTVQIGEQIWMAENLNVDSDGSLMYDDDSLNAEVYGRLYIWETAQNACPDGWHLPSDEEWMQLEEFLGIPPEELLLEDLRGTNEGGKLKETGTEHWRTPNEGAIDLYGFTALPGGYYEYGYVYFSSLGIYGFYWSSTDSIWGNQIYLGCYRVFDFREAGIHRSFDRQSHYMSVRCLKD